MMKSTFLNYVFYVMLGLIVLTFMGCPANPCPPLPVVQNITLIPSLDLDGMLKRYDSLRIMPLENTLKARHGSTFKDSRHITFNIDSVLNFISYIKYKMETNHLEIELSGIRAFYVVYPDTTKPGIVESNYVHDIVKANRNHHSLILAPTYKDNLGNEFAFDVNYFDEATHKPLPIDFENLNKLNRNLSFLNMGGLCPPGCQY